MCTRVKVREGSFNEITSILGWYEFINDIILDHLDDEIKSTNKSGVWRYWFCIRVENLHARLISFSSFRSSEYYKIVIILFQIFDCIQKFTACHWKYWDCFSLWNQIFDDRKSYARELYQICGAWHIDLGISKQLDSSSTILERKTPKHLLVKSLQIL